jgi:hypothetical protein
MRLENPLILFNPEIHLGSENAHLDVGLNTEGCTLPTRAAVSATADRPTSGLTGGAPVSTRVGAYAPPRRC